MTHIDGDPRLREDLPSLPPTMRELPIDERGYPVPWFVGWLSDDGKAVERGQGTPDFRMLHPTAIYEAVKHKKCWLCGQDLTTEYMAFVAGPMCGVNRTSSEPPSHLTCALFAAAACPFLARPKAQRREANKPEGGTMPGIALLRNPGVTLVWVTKRYSMFKAGEGVLFDMGSPEATYWYREGRNATRAEAEESIESGLPALMKVAEEVGPGDVEALERMVRKAKALLPHD